MRTKKEIITKRIAKCMSLFLCLVLAFSSLQVIQADAAVAVPGTHYLTPYQTAYLDIYDNEELKFFKMMGVDYYQGVQHSDYAPSERIALYNLDENFDSVSFKVGHIDGANETSYTLNVYTDNELVKQIELTGDMVTQTVTVDTRNIQQLKFIYGGGRGAYGIAEVTGTGGHVCESEVTKIATVKQSGIRTYTCKYCDYSYTEIIDAKTDCISSLKPYQTVYFTSYINDEKSYFNVMGKRYYDGYANSGYTPSDKEMLFNLAQNYSEVTFTVGHVDYADRAETTLYVYSDGTQQKEIPLDANMINKTITVNTEGVTQLKLTYGSGRTCYAIFDINYKTDLKPVHSFEEKIDEAGGFVTYTCKNCGAYYIEPYKVEVKGITLNPKTLTLEVGDSDRLTARVTPDNAADPSVEWFSSDEEVATVDANGNVKAIGKGSAAIIAKAGTFTAECKVTVTEKQEENKPVTDPDKPSGEQKKASLTLSKSAVTLYTGKATKTAQVTAHVTGNSNKVTWKSLNTAVAKVSSNGKITAVSKGTAKVTASANGIQKTVSVTVKDPTITVKKGSKKVKSVTVKRKKTVKLSLSVKPSHSGIKLSPLTSKQKKIASVKISGSKLVVTGKKKGKFNVKLKSGNASKTIKIIVKK